MRFLLIPIAIAVFFTSCEKNTDIIGNYSGEIRVEYKIETPNEPMDYFVTTGNQTMYVRGLQGVNYLEGYYEYGLDNSCQDYGIFNGNKINSSCKFSRNPSSGVIDNLDLSLNVKIRNGKMTLSSVSTIISSTGAKITMKSNGDFYKQ
jgi:hypothetical protein